MSRRFILSLAVGAIVLAPAPGMAQLRLSAGCTPGISSCASVRFFLEAVSAPIGINSLFIAFLNPAWTFTGGPIGTYSAEDSFGPFSGFTAIGPATRADIWFTDNGFPLDVQVGQASFVDLQASGSPNGEGLFFEYGGLTDTGDAFSGTVTPEPISLLMISSGLAGIAAARRRRKSGNAGVVDEA